MAGDNDPGLQRFLAEAANHPILTAQQERDLSRRLLAGDDDARRQLVRANLRLVISIARGYASRAPFGDVIQEGVLGLDRAARKFDPDRGFKFSTYATWWIRQSIQRGLSGSGSTIRLPPHVAKIRAQARTALRKDPMRDLAELAVELETDLATLERSLDAAEVVTSIDREVFDTGTPHTLQESIADPNAVDPAAAVQGGHDGLLRALEQLPEVQRDVLVLRFGVGGTEPLPLAEIAVRLGLRVPTIQTAQREGLARMHDLLNSPAR